MILASEEVRQKNAEVYAQRKKTYQFWLRANIVACALVIAAVFPWIVEKEPGIWSIVFWTTFGLSLLLSGVAEIFRQRAIRAGRGNW